jgi:hypothetical protein
MLRRCFWALVLSACASSSPRTDEPVHDATPEATKLASYGLEHVGLELPGEDVCEKNEDGTFKEPIEEGKYQGILRNARCDQQKWITMANVTYALGVACRHCHVPHPTDPKKELYDQMTEEKRTANWMCGFFIQALRPTDGTKMMCKSCHTDVSTGKPVAKILGDRQNVQEWMNEVMTVKFVEANGKRLKCKTCHVGSAPGQPGWQGEVIDQLRYNGKIER